MKKLFFFRSSTDKAVGSENSPIGGLNDQLKKKDDGNSRSLRSLPFENQKSSSKNRDVDTDFGLRRSHSFSSAAFLGNTRERNLSCLSDRSSSPSSSSSSAKAQQQNQSYW